MAFLFAGKVWFDKQRCGGAAGLCPVEATAPTFCEVDSFASSPAAERTGVHERTCGTRIAALRPGAAAGFRSRSDRFYQQTFPPRPAAAGCPQAKSIPQGSAGRSLPPQPPPAEARCSRPLLHPLAWLLREPQPVPAAPKNIFPIRRFFSRFLCYLCDGERSPLRATRSEQKGIRCESGTVPAAVSSSFRIRNEKNRKSRAKTTGRKAGKEHETEQVRRPAFPEPTFFNKPRAEPRGSGDHGKLRVIKVFPLSRGQNRGAEPKH